MRNRLFLPLLILALAAASRPCCAKNAPPDAWVGVMQKVHEGFAGTPGYVAQYGDSITVSMAFWKPLSWSDPDKYIKDDGLPKRPEGKHWSEVIKGAGDDGKGADAANDGGWRIGNLLASVPHAIASRKPEVAIIMIGTNDISGGAVPADYRPGLEKVIGWCLEAHCIPILNTIPPKRDAMEAVQAANKIVRAIAEVKNLPLVDYYEAIMAHAADGKWDGTLISSDGVHPSGGATQDYSEENLAKSGYALRNYVNFLMYREIYFKILVKK